MKKMTKLIKWMELDFPRVTLLVGGFLIFYYGFLFKENIGAEDNLLLRSFISIPMLLMFFLNYNKKFKPFIDRIAIIFFTSSSLFLYVYFCISTAHLDGPVYISYLAGTTHAVVLFVILFRDKIDLIPFTISLFICSLWYYMSAELHPTNMDKEMSLFSLWTSYFIGYISYSGKKKYLTEWQKEKEKNRAMSKLRDVNEVTSLLSHNINNPLQTLDSISNVLELQIQSSDLDSAQDSAKEMKTSIQEINKILKLLNAYSVNSVGERSRPLDVLLELSKKYSFKYYLPNESVEILMSKKELHDVLSGLIENSLEANTGNPNIFMNFNVTSSNVNLEYSDGYGEIPKEIQEKMFNLGFSTKDVNKKSLGLGLSYAQAYLNKNGGDISYSKGIFHLNFQKA